MVITATAVTNPNMRLFEARHFGGVGGLEIRDGHETVIDMGRPRFELGPSLCKSLMEPDCSDILTGLDDRPVFTSIE